MEVKIGVRHAARELVVDTAESAEDIQSALSQALADDGVLAITDTRGRQIVVPARNVAYLEIGTGVSGQVGFRG